MKIKRHIVINSSTDIVYSVAERYPVFVEEFQKKEILFSSASELHVRVTNKMFGAPFVWEGIGKKNKEKRQINWVQTKGLFKGMSVIWSIMPKDINNSEVTIEGQLKLNNPCTFKAILAWILVPKAVNRILRSLKKNSECIS